MLSHRVPTARPGSPCSTDPMVTASSGAEVAPDTTTSPMTKGEIRSRVANEEAPRTSDSPPRTNNTSPATTKAISRGFTPPV